MKIAPMVLLATIFATPSSISNNIIDLTLLTKGCRSLQQFIDLQQDSKNPRIISQTELFIELQLKKLNFDSVDSFLMACDMAITKLNSHERITGIH